MPWTAADAERHTSHADTAQKRHVWAQVANEALKRTGDDSRAIREANAAVGRMKRSHPHPPGTRALTGRD